LTKNIWFDHESNKKSCFDSKTNKKKPKPKQIEKELEQQIKPPKIKNNERKKHQKTK
jgi:hypothetical protein